MSSIPDGSEWAIENQRIPTGELLASIHELAEELGRTPTAREYRERARYSLHPIKRRFGRWNAALEAADLTPNNEYAIGEDRLIADLLAVSETLGRAPTRREYREHGQFADTALQREFGSWSAALEAAGLDVAGCAWNGLSEDLRALATGGSP